MLLDSYLDNVIGAQTYKTNKNELFQEKLIKNEEITKINTNGSSWLEPFREFIGSALSCAKIARICLHVICKKYKERGKR